MLQYLPEILLSLLLNSISLKRKVGRAITLVVSGVVLVVAVVAVIRGTVF